MRFRYFGYFIIFVGILILTQCLYITSASTQTQPPSSRLELTTEETEWLQEHPKIRVSNELDWPPFDFVDEEGKPAGYSIELLDLVAEQIGIKFEYINGLTWNELLEAFKHKEIDLIHCVYYSEERTQYARFSEPYFFNNLAVFSREEDEFQSIDDLAGRVAAIPAGYSLSPILEANIKDYQRVEIDNMIEALQVISSGVADYTIESFATSQYIIRENAIPNVRVAFFLQLPNVDPNQFNLRFAVHLDNPTLFEIAQKALNSIPEERIRELKNKWFGVEGADSDKNINQISLTNSQKDYLQNIESLRFCFASERLPLQWVDRNGDYQGISVEVANMISKRIGKDIKSFSTVNPERLLESSVEQQCNAIALITQPNELIDGFELTNSYQNIDLVIATKQDQVYIQNMSAVAGEKIGVVKGSLYQKLLEADYPDIEVVPVWDMEQGLKKVRDGKILGFVDNLASLAYLIQEDGFVSAKISGRLPELIQLKLGVRKDEEVLHSILSQAVDSISLQEQQELTNEWINVKYEQGVNYGLLWRWLIIFLVVMLVVFYWNRKLATANSKIRHLNKRLEVENVRMGDELEVAQRMQQMILPRRWELEAIASLDIVGYMKPNVEVGGDYYDVLVDNGAITIGIGDVTGHGFESGLVMMMVQTIIRTLKELQETDPVRFLNAVNTTLYKNLVRMGVERYLTLTILNYVDGYLSIMGQHEEILLIHTDGTIERLDTLDLGMTIGLVDDITEFIAQITVELQPGDGIVLYTDGITEARNYQGDFYGLDRLCQVIQQYWSKDVQGVQKGVITDLHEFIGDRSLADDVTLLILRKK